MLQNIKGLTGLRGGTCKNLFVEGSTTGATDGVVVFAPATALADLPSTVRAIAIQSTTPKFWTGAAWSTSWGSGTGASTWDEIYSNDKTLTIDSTTLTFSLTHATNDGLTITGAAGSSGDCIQITNSGTGSDIEGTSATWSISKAGAAVLTGITGCDTLVAAANLALDATGAGTITLAGTSTGAITLTTATTCGAALTVTTTLTVGTGATFSDGLVDIIDNSNTASGLRVTNDTVTTYGNAADAGVVVMRSETLSTGTLLHLSVDESDMAGGYFFRCWSQDLGSAAFTIGEYGVTTIAGPAAGGSAALTVTAGDVAFSDASLTITDADNAATISGTNNTATTASVIVLAGSGVFTGSTTTSWMTVTASGMTTGTAIYVPGAALTEGKLLHLTSGATQTIGSLLYAQDTGANSAITSGTVATFDETASALTSNTNRTGSTVSIASSRTTTTATVADDFDNLVISRTVVDGGAGSISSAGALLKLTDTLTGSPTATHVGIELTMASGGTGSGLALTHNTATATAASITSVATSGIGLLVTQGTGVMTTGAVVRVNSSGVSTGTGQGTLLDLVSSGAQTALICSLVTAALTTGKMFVMTGNALTTSGVGLDIGSTGTGMTSGSLLKVSTGTTAAVATSGIVSLQATGNYTSTSNQGFVGIIANSTVAGTIASISGAALTTGVGLYLTNGTSAMTTGSLLKVVASGTGAIATSGIVSLSHAGIYTSTTVGFVNVATTASTGGTAMTVTASALTDGTCLQLSNAAITTGKHFNILGAAGASMFSISVNGATVIAGLAGTTELTVAAGDVSFADGSLAIADNDNAAATLSVANDTATTTGAAANLGVVDISGDGLTTGTLVNLSITDGTLTTGRYIKGWDVTRGAEDWAIIEDGVAYFAEGIGTTAGGAIAISIGTSQAIDIVYGSGAPTLTASQGSLYLRTDGSSTSTRLYVNTDGANTWTNVTTAA